VRAKTSPVPIGEAIDGFLLPKRVNCSIRTVQIYRYWLDRLAAVVPDTATPDSLALARFLTTVNGDCQSLRFIKRFARFGHSRSGSW
jgi:hypothetical protein